MGKWLVDTLDTIGALALLVLAAWLMWGAMTVHGPAKADQSPKGGNGEAGAIVDASGGPKDLPK